MDFDAKYREYMDMYKNQQISFVALMMMLRDLRDKLILTLQIKEAQNGKSISNRAGRK